MDNIKIIDSATNFYRWLIIKFDNILFNINFCFKFFYCILYIYFFLIKKKVYYSFKFEEKKY